MFNYILITCLIIFQLHFERFPFLLNRNFTTTIKAKLEIITQLRVKYITIQIYYKRVYISVQIKLNCYIYLESIESIVYKFVNVSLFIEHLNHKTFVAFITFLKNNKQNDVTVEKYCFTFISFVFLYFITRELKKTFKKCSFVYF